MVNSQAKDSDDDDDSTGPYSKQAVREAMQFDRRRVQTGPNRETSEEPPEKDKDNDNGWECAKCGYGDDAYDMDELNERFATPGGQEIHYGCRKNG